MILAIGLVGTGTHCDRHSIGTSELVDYRSSTAGPILTCTSRGFAR